MTDQAHKDAVLVEKKGGKGIITINRPKVLNAIDWETFFLLQEALENLIADQETRVIILTGAGEKSFISGGDIGEELKMDGLESYRWSLTGHKLCATIEASTKPVIAAMNGYCLAGDLSSHWPVTSGSVRTMPSSVPPSPSWVFAADLAEISVCPVS